MKPPRHVRVRVLPPLEALSEFFVHLMPLAHRYFRDPRNAIYALGFAAGLLSNIGIDEALVTRAEADELFKEGFDRGVNEPAPPRGVA